MNGSVLQIAASRFLEGLLPHENRNRLCDLDQGMETMGLVQDLLAPYTTIRTLDRMFADEVHHILDAGAYIAMLLKAGWQHMGIAADDLEDDAENLLEARLSRSSFLNDHPNFDFVIVVYPVVAHFPDGSHYVQIPGIDLLDIIATPFDPMPCFSEHPTPLNTRFDLIEHYFLGALLLNSAFALGNWRQKHPRVDPTRITAATDWIRQCYKTRLKPLKISQVQEQLLYEAIDASVWPPPEFPDNAGAVKNVTQATRSAAAIGQRDVLEAGRLLVRSRRRSCRIIGRHLIGQAQKITLPDLLVQSTQGAPLDRDDTPKGS